MLMYRVLGVLKVQGVDRARIAARRMLNLRSVSISKFQGIRDVIIHDEAQDW